MCAPFLNRFGVSGRLGTWICWLANKCKLGMQLRNTGSVHPENMYGTQTKTGIRFAVWKLGWMAAALF